MGGLLLRVGLGGMTLAAYFELDETRIPGEADDMEVGVELILNGPGE